MPNDDVFSAIKDSLTQTLNEVADKEIEKLVDKFRCELGKQRALIIGSLIDSIELSMSRESVKDTTVFQINIRSADNA